jgi:hypothetical protein
MAAKPTSRWMAVLAGVLFILGTVYTSAGVGRLVGDVPGSFPVDLRLRWIESRLLVDGQNNQDVGHPDPLLAPTHEVMIRSSGGYPPWSYAFGLLFAPPVDWTLTRWWFAAISVVSMLVIGLIAWSHTRPLGSTPALVAAMLVFTNFSNAICLSYGQYGVVASGLVFGAAWLLQRDRQVSSGVALGLALVKPQLSASYCVALVGARRWSAVAVAGGTILVGTTIMAAMVGESPWSVTFKALHDMGDTHISNNPVLRAAPAVLGRSTAILLIGAAGTAATLFTGLRHATDHLRLAAIAVIVGMFWTPWKHFDVAMMSIPLIWLWTNAVSSGRAIHYAIFFATGATLWLPLRDAQWNLWWVGLSQLIIWSCAGILIARPEGLKSKSAS